MKSSEQCALFDRAANILKDVNVDIGGDFNIHLDSNLDNLGGRIGSKPSVIKVKRMMIANDLIDIWRICNPYKKQCTWSQGNL